MTTTNDVILAQFADPAERAEAEAAIRENEARLAADEGAQDEHESAERAHRLTWKAYKEARGLVMSALVNQPGSVSNEYGRLGGLTDREYQVVRDRRIEQAQVRWADFQSAERWLAAHQDLGFRQP
ncbi:hypothetical protein MRBLWH7_000344 [Microbacterium sp. LWH7-1.2]|uniref:hypothetical protein n=1 Tax=Microbacterium sp. LWH7-1.2 TaxID=3135257 RepID=UPI003139B3BC